MTIIQKKKLSVHNQNGQKLKYIDQNKYFENTTTKINKSQRFKPKIYHQTFHFGNIVRELQKNENVNKQSVTYYLGSMASPSS